MDDLEGRVVAGKYAVMSVIGRGAMGVVYRARQVALDKVVALKVLGREVRDDPEFVRRFHTEARAASRLEHPNSTRVLDFGEEPDGLLYIAMELLEGRSLTDVVAHDFPLDASRVASILSQTLSAVGAAHALKILHRDLKPDNIVILEARDDEDRPVDIVKVCDFGIAKLETEQEPTPAREGAPLAGRATHAGVVVGTPQYMSPEQALAQPLDVRSDLYALGIVLYEMLTQRPPFDGETAAEVLRHHVATAPPRPSSLAAHVDPTLEAVCLRALQKLPAHRFASAREMRVALRPLTDHAAHEVIPARPSERKFDAGAPTVSAEPVAVKVPSPARPRVLWAVPVLALVVVGAGAYVMVKRQGPRVAAAQTALTSVTPRPSEPERLPASVAQHEPPLDLVASPAPTSPRITRRTPLPQGRGAVDSPPNPSVTETASPPETVATLVPPPPTTVEPTSTVSSVTMTQPSLPRADPALARVVMGTVRADRVDPASVESALRHVDFTSCFRTEVGAGHVTDGDATLALDMDDQRVTRATLMGGSFAPALRQCISARAMGARVPNVDTGDASAKVVLRFFLR